MRLNVNKTRVMPYSRKTNILSYEYQLCHTSIARTSSIKGLCVFFDSKLYFHTHVDFLFSKCIKLLGLIRSITFRFSSFDCLHMLYFTLVRSKLEYASVVWNSITSTRVPHCYTFALEKLNLHPLRKQIHHLDVLFFLFFFFLFRPIVALNPALPSWKKLVFVFLLAIL
jgi:hypothetical protein